MRKNTNPAPIVMKARISPQNAPGIETLDALLFSRLRAGRVAGGRNLRNSRAEVFKATDPDISGYGYAR